LYAKFVAHDQQRQTLRTRARREQASAEDLTAYGDFLRKTGYVADAVTQYERVLSLRPKDERTRAKLAALYGRLRMPESQAALALPQAAQPGNGG
jgi:Flp pilus assembly protein TadD